MSTVGRALVAVGLLLAIAGACVVGEVQTPSCRTALVIIDVQSAWLGPDALTIDGILVQEKTAGIASIARANGIPIVFVKDVAYQYRFTDQQLEIAPPLAILEGERLVEKMHPNGFADTPLAELLRSMGVTTLLIAGYASHGCVSATVAGALENGFEVIIIADGHSGGGMGTSGRRSRTGSGHRAAFRSSCAPRSTSPHSARPPTPKPAASQRA